MIGRLWTRFCQHVVRRGSTDGPLQMFHSSMPRGVIDQGLLDAGYLLRRSDLLKIAPELMNVKLGSSAERIEAWLAESRSIPRSDPNL